jgi:hypothetical protein
MEEAPAPRWSLNRVSTNSHNITRYTVSCRDKSDGPDYEEFKEVLERDFGAVYAGNLVGPYFAYEYFEMFGLKFGGILDELDFYADDPGKCDKDALGTLVGAILVALNRRRMER